MPAIDFSLALRRRRAGEAFDLSDGVLPPGAVLTRGSPGWRVGADGQFGVVAANGARFDHVAGSGTRRGLLIEPQRTNLIASSADFGLPWLRDGLADGGSPVAGPLGGNAVAISENGDSPFHYLRRDAPAGSNVLSVHARAAGRRWLWIYAYNATTAMAFFDLIDGQPGARVGGVGSSIDSLGGGWWRCTMAYSYTAESHPIGFGLAMTQGALMYGGDASAGVWLTGAQIEAGPAPTSHIPATGAVATRAADRLALDWGGLGVADGNIAIRYVFDDGSDEVRAATVVAGTTIVPTDLARTRLRRIERA